MLNSPWIRKPNFRDVKEMDYNEYWERRGWRINKSLKPRELVMLEMTSAESKIVDIGCGNSLLPLKLKEKKCEVSVADISDVVLGQYAKLGIKSLQINLQDADKIILPEQYDYVILSEVLEHLVNPEQAIKALKKYAGRFLITIPNSAYYQFRYSLMFRGRFFTQWVYHPSEHLRYWSHTDFCDWLAALGLEVEESKPSDGFTLWGLLPFLPRVWKNLFGFRMVYKCRSIDSYEYKTTDKKNLV